MLHPQQTFPDVVGDMSTLWSICDQLMLSQDTIQPEAKDVARLLCGECFFAPLAEATRYEIQPSAAFTLAIALWPGRDTRLGLFGIFLKQLNCWD